MKINRSKIFQWLKIIVPVFLMLFAIHEIGKIIKEANGSKISSEIGSIDVRTLVLIGLIPLVLAFPMFFYDYFIMKKLKLKIPIKRLLKESLIINSFSNLIGFGGLVGVLLRTHYFKKPEMENTLFFKMIASVTLFYLAGISLFSDILLIFFWDLKLFAEHQFLLAVAGFIGLYTPFLLVKSCIQFFRKKITTKQIFSDLLLILVSVVEWIGAFFMLVILTRLLHIDVPLVELWPTFVIASAAGIVSMIPGGLGSFDLVFIWGATSLNIPSESVLVLLLFYRIGYYVIPFIAGLLLFLRDIWRSINIGYNKIPNALLEKITHIVSTALVFFAGLALLVSSAAPGAVEKLKYVREIMSLPIVNMSHQISVVTGFLLLALSNGISYKDKRSYKLTFFVLIFASALFILKGVQYRQALFMIFVAVLLYFSKNRFYRKSYVVTWGRSILNTAIIGIIIVGYFILGVLAREDSAFKLSNKVQKLLITDPGDLFRSAGIGIIVIILVVSLETWMRSRAQFKKTTMNSIQKKIVDHIQIYGGGESVKIIYDLDQFVFWNTKRTVLFPYRVSADKLIVIGDLIGEQKHFKKAVEEFISFADVYGYTPVFYEVSDQFIPYLYGYGYNFFRLGEEGYVDMKENFMDDFSKLKFERISEEMTRSGYYYELLEAPFSHEFALKLDSLSQKWSRHENQAAQQFSDEYALNFSSIAVIRNSEAQIVAFAYLTPFNDNHQTISVSLLRSMHSELPQEAMDFFLTSILLSAKEEGYDRINIGMTYMKHVGISKYAGVLEKIAAQIIVDGQEPRYQHDIQDMKENYATSWVPKYIAYRKRVFLPFTMIQIMMLIGDNKFSNFRNQIIAARNSRKRS